MRANLCLWVRPAKMFFETVERDGKKTTARISTTKSRN